MTDEAVIREAILLRVHERGVGKTVCPSEVARALAEDETAWRALMPAVRAVAASLANDGAIATTQKGQVVDALTAHGPIRLGLPPKT